MFRRRLLWDALRMAFRSRRWRTSGGYSTRTHWRHWFGWRPGMLVALAGFSFKDKGISDDVIQDEKNVALNYGEQTGWEVVVDKEDVRVYRRQRFDSCLYEYRCVGSFKDISGQDFVDAQVDLCYRQKWDANVVKLEVLEEDNATNSDVVRWVAKFPYPMYPREYVYVRRRQMDDEGRCMVIASSSLDSDQFPVSGDYVRVSSYHSVMVVRSHSSFADKGMDYVLTYYDDPESNIPSYAYNWIINHGGPHFLSQVYTAAKELERLREESAAQKPLIVEVGEEDEHMGTDLGVLVGVSRRPQDVETLSLKEAESETSSSSEKRGEALLTSSKTVSESAPSVSDSAVESVDAKEETEAEASENLVRWGLEDFIGKTEDFDLQLMEVGDMNRSEGVSNGSVNDAVGAAESKNEIELVTMGGRRLEETETAIDFDEVRTFRLIGDDASQPLTTDDKMELEEGDDEEETEDAESVARQTSNVEKPTTLLRERIKAYLMAEFPLANAPELLKLAD